MPRKMFTCFFKLSHIWRSRWCTLGCSAPLGKWVGVLFSLSFFIFCFFLFIFFTPALSGSLTFLSSRPTHPHPARLSPAASAPASSSPAALLPTRPLSVRRWRFIVCWWWISTPLKVRPPRMGHFLFALAAADAQRGEILHTALRHSCHCCHEEPRLYPSNGIFLSFVLMQY